MGAVHVILDGDGAIQDWITPDLVHFTADDDEIRAIYLSHAMVSGKPGVLIAAKGKGGLAVIEMGYEMFQSIAAAFMGRRKYEEDRDRGINN